MGHVAGAKNYKKEVLLEVVKEIFPNGAYAWEQVMSAYRDKSGESYLHDNSDDIRRIIS